MKIYRVLFAIVFLTLCVLDTMAQKSVIWQSPTTEYGNVYGDGFFQTSIDVTKVEMRTDETIIHLNIRQRSDYPGNAFVFVKDTYLLAGGKRYKAVSAEGIEFDQWRQTEKNGQLNAALHFEPLPQDTKVFDFIEGDADRAFKIRGIKPIEERWNQLYPSYWRDEDTGDWTLAMLDNCVLYDSQFWTYKTRPAAGKPTAKQTFTISNGKDEAQVTLGKMTKGKRAIQINGKNIAASMITTRFLPDYPKKDTRTDFVDTGYKTDTATIIGWLKDMPENFKKDKFFSVAVNDFVTDDQIDHKANLDSLGRFCLKVPLLGSSEAFCDWNKCFLRTILEPGKTYFLLYDFREGRRFFMGNDVRLQNELLKYPLHWSHDRMERGEDFDKYIEKTDSLINAEHAYVNDLCTQHPNLSARFSLYFKENILAMSASNIGQARFSLPGTRLTEHGKKYAYERFWTKMSQPYTLHRDWRLFMRDYVDDLMNGVQKDLSFHTVDYLDDVASNEEERAFAKSFKEAFKDAEDKIMGITDEKEKERAAKRSEAELSNMVKRANDMLNSERGQRIIGEKILSAKLKQDLLTLDSIGATPAIKTLRVITQTLEMLDYYRSPLSQSTLDTLAAMADNASMFQAVREKNDYYIALDNKKIDDLVLKSNDTVEGIKEGKEILSKLTEPYRGKYVLLDVWGTWCGPCKAALSHSKEEYERLAKYDIWYLYLANHSQEDTWKTVIKEYDVTGDNVAHYNLPQEQQQAIEAYIGLRGYPTYKLIDPEGRVLDVKVDPRDLDSTEKLLKQLIGEEDK